MNLSHNSRQVAKCPANLVHGIAGTKPAARYDSLVPDFKSQLGYAQDLGRGPLGCASRNLDRMRILWWCCGDGEGRLRAMISGMAN